MDELRITIEGKHDTGKTTTANIIKNALEEAGYKNVKVMDVEPLPEEEKDRFQWRLERTRARPVRIHVKVVIESTTSRADESTQLKTKE